MISDRIFFYCDHSQIKTEKFRMIMLEAPWFSRKSWESCENSVWKYINRLEKNVFYLRMVTIKTNPVRNHVSLPEQQPSLDSGLNSIRKKISKKLTFIQILTEIWTKIIGIPVPSWDFKRNLRICWFSSCCNSATTHPFFMFLGKFLQ